MKNSPKPGKRKTLVLERLLRAKFGMAAQVPGKPRRKRGLSPTYRRRKKQSPRPKLGQRRSPRPRR